MHERYGDLSLTLWYPVSSFLVKMDHLRYLNMLTIMEEKSSLFSSLSCLTELTRNIHNNSPQFRCDGYLEA
jgi:hypothetical protein